MRLRGKWTFLWLIGAIVQGSDLNVTITSDRLYIGEPAELTYSFVRPPGDDAVDFRFAAPQLAHFRVLDSRVVEQTDNGRQLWQKRYTVVPLQSGPLETGAAAMNVASRTFEKDDWGQWMPAIAWKQLHYETVKTFVYPFPSGAEAVGDFRLEAMTDKNVTEAGSPVRLTLSLKGCGDLRTAEPLRMAVHGVRVFDEGQTLHAVWKDGCYYSERNQTFALVGDTDFTIPQRVFRSFDPGRASVATTQSLPIGIHVIGAEIPSGAADKKREDAMTLWSVAVGTGSGFVFGVLLTLLAMRRKKRERKVRFDSFRSALTELLKHLDDPEAKQSAEALERYLYEGAEAPDEGAISNVAQRMKRRRG